MAKNTRAIKYKNTCYFICGGCFCILVRDKGVEPFTSVWKTDVLPIN